MIYNKESRLSSINATNGDINFTNNSSSWHAGAILNAGGYLNLNATGGDIIFTGNLADHSSNCINNSTEYPKDPWRNHDFLGHVNFNAANGHSIILNDSMSGYQGTYVTKDGDGTLNLNADMNGYSPDLTINDGIIKLGANGTMFNPTKTTVNGGMFDFQNYEIQQTNLGALTLNSDMEVKLDIDLYSTTSKIDNFVANSVADGDKKFIIRAANLKMLSDPDVTSAVATVANNVIQNRVVIDDVSKFYNIQGSSHPWLLDYDSTTGQLSFTRVTLNIAVNSDISNKVYNMLKTEYATGDLGALGGKSLTINANNKLNNNRLIYTPPQPHCPTYNV